MQYMIGSFLPSVGIEEERHFHIGEHSYPYYGIAATIAVNMIMAAASGGVLAVAIAVWAQVCFVTKVLVVYMRCEICCVVGVGTFSQ